MCLWWQFGVSTCNEVGIIVGYTSERGCCASAAGGGNQEWSGPPSSSEAHAQGPPRPPTRPGLWSFSSQWPLRDDQATHMGLGVMWQPNSCGAPWVGTGRRLPSRGHIGSRTCDKEGTQQCSLPKALCSSLFLFSQGLQ